MQILLIRHGQSEADILNVHEGRADYPLTGLGREQARLMAKRVTEDYRPDVIYASTLCRASETASILSKAAGAPLNFEDKLREHDNGVLAGVPFEEEKKYFIPKTMYERFEKGESAIEFRMRVESIFSKILTECCEQRIAIVAHGGVIHCLLRSFFKMGVHIEFSFPTGDTGIHLLEIKGAKRIIHFLNDTSHTAAIPSTVK
ncbi:histidine phosphatase family protein [Fictibacillus sp. WQ 8-8]|uniref:histidine phosphatase family protein n=1 Tax=Fictibacillus sp. WQ 8-8 TaxID=2938788 RepID=UPI00210C4145|nr:histidine phosphatase family protein [Fictibacillus sp. WQ 8-8]MCQ6266837.1 histidine phosphatase family protein [Fictibacillus sp. WQ 8-8]